MDARKWSPSAFGGPEVLGEVAARVPDPEPAEVTIDGRAVGVNHADYRHFAARPRRKHLGSSIGFEAAGVLTAVGPDTEIASGGGAVGDEVLAFQLSNGYQTAITVTADNVFAKPRMLSFPQAANLLLAGTTAAEMLDVADVQSGDTVLVHGASGGVGTSAVQQARLLGAIVIGTTSEQHADLVAQLGAVPVRYGAGFEDRVVRAAPGGIAAALDTAGTGQAIDLSLALIADRRQIVTIAADSRARRDGFAALGGVLSVQRCVPGVRAAAADRARGSRQTDRADRRDVPLRAGAGGAAAADGGPSRGKVALLAG